MEHIHLQEYSALSSAIAEAVRRIDTVRGIYLAAAAAVFMKVVSLDPDEISTTLVRISNDPHLATAALVLAIINSVLLIHVASFMHFILAAAQYNTYSLGPKLQKAAGHPVLQFDTVDSEEKEAWVFTRTMLGVLYFALATAVSMSILISLSAAGRFQAGTVAGIVYILATYVVALSIIVALVAHLLGRRFHNPKPPKRIRVRRLYWVSCALFGVMYLVLLRL